MILGIDPGLSGAIALLDGERCVEVWDMPVTEKLHGKGREVNAYLLVDVILEALEMDEGLAAPVAYVERVSAMPGQGVSGMFSLGRSAGVVAGVLAAWGVRVEYVTPQAWKRSQGLLKKSKDASRTLAIQRWPEMREQLKLKKHDGRAEAMLIADYGRAA
mgnify:CR=1 FL=1